MEKHKYKYFVYYLIIMIKSKIEPKILYYWIKRDGKICYSFRQLVPETDYKGFLMTEVNHLLEDLVKLKIGDSRLITIAESEGITGIAILHPKDENIRVFNAKLGRTIATGRLLKKLKKIKNKKYLKRLKIK